MNCGENLRDLLAPLGVYRWEGSFQWGELQSEGEALDQVARELAELQGEMNLATAAGWGLETVAALLPWRPEGEDRETLRQALMSLLRTGEDSFTPAAVNETLQSCGVAARVEETEDPLRLRVLLLETGEGDAALERIQAVVQAVLPCHVQVEYQFRALTWSALEGRFSSWSRLEAEGRSWQSLGALEL